jgi:phytoene dehydrogenase-like protein
MRQIASGVGVRYLDGGWQRVVDALAERARQLGGEIRLRAKVESIEPDRGRVGAVIVDGARVECGRVVVTLSPKASVALLGEAAPSELRRFAESAAPVRAACLDVALRSLPRSAPKLVLGVDRPTYLSVHSRTAKLAPDGGAVIHVARYLAPEEQVDSPSVRAELEAELDDAQPGWRAELVRARWSPALLVAHALAEASQRGLAGRPSVDATGIEGVTLAADWVGPRGLLFDACLESARAAVEATTPRTRAAA